MIINIEGNSGSGATFFDDLRAFGITRPSGHHSHHCQSLGGLSRLIGSTFLSITMIGGIRD